MKNTNKTESLHKSSIITITTAVMMMMMMMMILMMMIFSQYFAFICQTKKIKKIVGIHRYNI